MANMTLFGPETSFWLHAADFIHIRVTTVTTGSCRL